MKTFNKKLIVLLISFILLFTTILPTSVFSASGDPIIFSVIGAEGTAGETVTVKINMENNTGLQALSGYVVYDSSKLQYVSAKINGLEKADFIRNVVHYENDGEILINCGTTRNSMEDNGVILTIQFKIKDNATGTAEISLRMQDIYKTLTEKADYTTKTGAVTINVPVTGVKLEPATLTLEEGTSQKLTATVEPTEATNKNIKWTSNPENIVNISDDGTVTAVKAGVTTVTVTTTDGNKSASCKVTVVECLHEHTTSHPAVASTCKEHGHDYYETCDKCGKVVKGSNAPLELADHTYGNLIPEVPMQHLEDGTLIDGTAAHYKCSVCNKLFDVDYDEVQESELVIKASHSYGNEYKSDETNHWKECGCGNKILEEAHRGGEATCTKPAVCEVCGTPYGEPNSNNHKNTERRNVKEATCTEKGYTGDLWCKDCNTKIEDGKETDLVPHKGGEATCTKPAVCEVCHNEYGEVDSSNHKNIELKNAKEATCTEDGKEADKYCKDCEKLVEEGKVIKATGHKGGEANCVSGAICEVCGEEYTAINPKNHRDIVIKDAKDATCTEDGYTGDTWCEACDTMLEEGEVIPAGHKGGEATCIKPAVCEVCGEEYGEVDPTNHKNTEVRNATEPTTEKEGYTGDVWCTDCETLVSKGEVIPAIKVEQPTNSTDSTKPNTADNSHIALWVSLLVISGICFVVVAKCDTKRIKGKHLK